MRRFPLLPGVIAMAAVVTASNILVQIRLGDWLTWGALTYPLAFLVTDLTNRLHGPAAARRVVLAGFAVGILCSLAAAGLGRTTLRIALGSGSAFLVAQLLDVAVFDRLRRGAWWRAPLVSTLFGASLDTLIFFAVAFAAMFTFLDPSDDVRWASEMLPLLGQGPIAPLWLSLAAGDWLVKLALAAVALIPFRMIVRARIAAGAIRH